MPQWYEAVHAAKRFRLGTRKFDIAENEYIYLKGVASTVANDWVVYDELGVTTRMITTSIGPVAIAKGATDATTKFGWYLINGTGLGNAAAGYADDATVNATATPGVADDNAVAAAAELNVFGAWGRSALSGSTATFQLSYPYKSVALLD